MELHTGKKNHLTRHGILLSIAVPARCSGGAARGILLWQGKGIVDPGSLYRGSLAGAVLSSGPAWIKTGRDIVSLLVPLYAVLVFLSAIRDYTNGSLSAPLWSRPGHPGRETEPVFQFSPG